MEGTEVLKHHGGGGLRSLFRRLSQAVINFARLMPCRDDSQGMRWWSVTPPDHHDRCDTRSGGIDLQGCRLELALVELTVDQ